MSKQWKKQLRIHQIINLVLYFLCCVIKVKSCDLNKQIINCENNVENVLKTHVDQVLNMDEYTIIPGINIHKILNASNSDVINNLISYPRNIDSLENYVGKKLETYFKNHVLSVNVSKTARFLHETGKSSFLTGFGMGFLAFGLKKLLLPLFIGAQLVKSVLIAMFLPSIIGSLGKIVGKGLSTFSGISGASAGMNNNNNNQVEDFDFKDTSPYNNEDDINKYNIDGNALNQDSSTAVPAADNRFGIGNKRISYATQHQNENYYIRKPYKKTDYKVFHKIPSSSLLLTTYDPFYSPLLSRLDAIFQQLGLGYDKSSETERCKERLVCMMYANPAKYAPYSNLVSAQLSRELNELRKPASDNPEILRFFRYMKAAKDGQDGEECLAHKGCPSLNTKKASPAILTTFNDINKLVQARKLNEK